MKQCQKLQKLPKNWEESVSGGRRRQWERKGGRRRKDVEKEGDKRGGKGRRRRLEVAKGERRKRGGKKGAARVFKKYKLVPSQSPHGSAFVPHKFPDALHTWVLRCCEGTLVPRTLP